MRQRGRSHRGRFAECLRDRSQVRRDCGSIHTVGSRSRSTAISQAPDLPVVVPVDTSGHRRPKQRLSPWVVRVMDREPSTEPTQDEWLALYVAAQAFAAAKPWEHLSDVDLFGVKDPATGVIGHCSVMGNAGQHYALGVYLGGDGLQSFLDVLHAGSGDNDLRLSVAGAMQLCTMASFEDRRMLSQRDLGVVKVLGLKFRGSNAWPWFRRYDPGWEPWYLSDAAPAAQGAGRPPGHWLITDRCRNQRGTSHPSRPRTWSRRRPHNSAWKSSSGSRRRRSGSPPAHIRVDSMCEDRARRRSRCAWSRLG